uniref:Probable pectate lyase F n=1 Tax=Meloidogyne hapla TaxID=6305 RepID=A0A1I8C0M1_MELHA
MLNQKRYNLMVLEHYMSLTIMFMSNIIEGIRSCGNCKQQYRNREIHVDGLTVENLAYGQYVVGVNGNYGDKAYLKNIHVLRSKNIVVCRISEGNNGGTNPKIPQLTDDDVEYKQHCIYNKNDIYIGS